MNIELICFLGDIMDALSYVFTGEALLSLIITTVQMFRAELKYQKVLTEKGFKGDIDNVYDNYFKEKR